MERVDGVSAQVGWEVEGRAVARGAATQDSRISSMVNFTMVAGLVVCGASSLSLSLCSALHRAAAGFSGALRSRTVPLPTSDGSLSPPRPPDLHLGSARPDFYKETARNTPVEKAGSLNTAFLLEWGFTEIARLSVLSRNDLSQAVNNLES